MDDDENQVKKLKKCISNAENPLAQLRQSNAASFAMCETGGCITRLEADLESWLPVAFALTPDVNLSNFESKTYYELGQFSPVSFATEALSDAWHGWTLPLHR